MPLRFASRLLPIAAAILIAGSLAACSGSGLTLTAQRTQGYDIPKDALLQIRNGQSKELVMLVLGSPQFTNDFGDETAYYYVETKVDETAFGLTTIRERTVLAVYFGKNNKVTDKAVYGAKDGKVFAIESRRTPSYGIDRNFIESIVASF